MDSSLILRFLTRNHRVIAKIMKYIMLKSNRNGINYFCPVIFPNFLSHDQVAELMESQMEDPVIHSAGEISLFGLEGKCHGKSTTLSVESDSEADTRRIIMADYGGLIENAD